MLFLLIFSCFVRSSFCITCSYYDVDINGNPTDGYYIEIYLGTPPQKVNLLLDTGSSNLAVACVLAQENSSYFRCNESETCNVTPIEISLHYVGGEWKGFIVSDMIHLYNDSAQMKNYDSGTFELQLACMTSVSSIFDNESQFQGLLGLSYPAISKPDSSIIPFFETLVEKLNVCNIYSLSLCGPLFSSQHQNTTCGKLHLGHASKEYYDEQIFYTPVMREWYYEVMLTNLKVGKEKITVPCFELNKGISIIDSGSTNLKLPELIYDWVIKKLKAFTKLQLHEAFWHNQSIECVEDNNYTKLFPSLTIDFYHTSNSTFSLLVSPELYLSRTSVYSFCFKLGISKSEPGYGTVIGGTILKGFYVVFDRSNKQIGFSNSTFFKNSTLAGLVLPPVSTSNHLNCKWIKNSQSSVTTGMHILGCVVVLCALVFLFVAIYWICKTQIMNNKKNDESDSILLLTDDQN